MLVREDGFIFRKLLSKNWYKFSYTKGASDGHGYLVIKINGKNYRVHRLVAECFINNPNNLPTVDHIDRNRSNNNANNLRWASMLQQIENSALVLNRNPKISVRYKDNPGEYTRQRRRLKNESII